MNFKIFCQVLRFFIDLWCVLQNLIKFFVFTWSQLVNGLHTCTHSVMEDLPYTHRHGTPPIVSFHRFGSYFGLFFSLLYQPCWSLNRHYLAGSRTKSFHSSCSQFLPALTRFSLSHSSFNFLMLKWKTIDSLSSSVTSFWMRTKSD